MEEKKNPMGYKPIFPLLISMAFPPMISMLIQSLYNIIDSIFVAQLGESALTAVSLIFPLQNLSLAFSCGIGIAMNAMIARHLGANNDKDASHVASQGIVMSLLHSLLFVLIGLFFIGPFVHLFSQDKDVITYGLQYGTIVITFTFGSFIHIAVEKMFQACGNMLVPMIMQIIGALINIILDPIFIFVLDMGIKGAAIATVISQILSALLVFYFLHGKSELKVRWIHINEISECTRHARDIISLGSAGFIMQLTNSLVSICCNNVLSVTGGDIYISVMTIISSVRQMVETPIHAINEGTSPVLSYNYGARRPDRVKKAGVVLIIMVLIYTGIMWSVILISPEFLIGIFSSDKLLLKDAVPALKLYFAAFIFMDLQYIGQTVFKSLNKKKQAIFFSLLRKVFIVVPLTYFLPYGLHMGTDGVFMAEPVSNVIGGSLCFITMLVTILPELNKMGNSR